MRGDLHVVRTLVATLVGGTAGAILIGYAAGAFTAATVDGGWAALGIAVAAAAVGSFVGAAGALWMAFRHEDASERRWTALTVLVAGPIGFAVLSLGMAQLSPQLSFPPLYLAVALVGAALLGRWLGLRGTRHATLRRGAE